MPWKSDGAFFKTCPKCGAIVPVEFNFCPKCGTEDKIDEEDQEEEKKG